MENNNLYVNVNALMELIECMYQNTDNYHERKAYNEVENIILDLKWLEVKGN